jgi:hypothetical protein
MMTSSDSAKRCAALLPSRPVRVFALARLFRRGLLEKRIESLAFLNCGHRPPLDGNRKLEKPLC